MFDKPGDVTHWGLQQSSLSGCNADYKYYFSSNVLYVYAASNPVSYYNMIENPTKEIGCQLSGKKYITFDNLDFWGSRNANITTENAHYFTLQYCEVHHVGKGNTSNYDGYGLYNLSSNTWIHHNKFWEVGSHSIWHGMYGSYINRNSVIEYNYFLNDHYCCVDIQHTGTNTSNGDSRNHIVRFNWFNSDSLKQTSVGAGASIQILGEMPGGTPIWVRSVYFYGNVVIGYYDVMGRVADSIYVYNNTFINHQLNFRETRFDGAYQGKWTVPTHVWFFNNISYRHTSGNVVEECWVDTNKVFDNNLYVSDTGSPFRFGNSGYNFTQWKSLIAGDDNSMFTNDQTKIFTQFTGNSNTKDLIPKVGDFSVDMGYSIGEPFNVDIKGVTRPQGPSYDLGAYELVNVRK